jgi:creatinine amidohydrolase
MIDEIERDWSCDRSMSARVVATGINRCKVSPVPADRAGVFGSRGLFALWPDRMQEERLSGLSDSPDIDPDANATGDHRQDPSHLCRGSA